MDPEDPTALLRGRLFATASEVAAIMHVDSRTIRRGIERGEIPATRIGSTLRVPVAWIRAAAHVAVDDDNEAAA